MREWIKTLSLWLYTLGCIILTASCMMISKSGHNVYMFAIALPLLFVTIGYLDKFDKIFSKEKKHVSKKGNDITLDVCGGILGYFAHRGIRK